MDNIVTVLAKLAEMVTQPVKSTNLQAVGYDHAKKLLESQFRSGSVYHYPNTSNLRYKQLMAAASKGGYFHKHIRHNPDYIKVADEEMTPYQRRVVKRILQPDQAGLVVAHGLGTGKTRTSIEAYKRLKLPTNVILPAALKGNYQKELTRWNGRTPTDMLIESQQRIARTGMVNDLKGLLIVDEAHRAREGGSALITALQQSKARKKLLLTATPVFNHPKDLATVVNLAASRRVLPQDKKLFDEEYVNYKSINPSFFQRLSGITPGVVPELKNRSRLKTILNRYVDYYPGSSKGFPVKEEQVIKVPMGERQMAVYKTIMGKAPWWVRLKVKAGLPPARKELEAMRAFLSGARQVSNTTLGFVSKPSEIESAKIDKAFAYLQKNINANPRYKGVVYSNYLTSGLSPYKQKLEQSGIPFGEFSGEVSPVLRNKMVQDYNANKLRALLISSAGSEGIDLKGTRLIQILEPHFNEQKENQVIGRGVRYRSHDGLPPAEQKVTIQRYLAQPRASLLDKLFGKKEVKGADEYIRNLALQKSLLTKQVTDLLNEQNKGL